MISLGATCAVGLGLGVRHALESDHVAAITTLVTAGQGARRAAVLGMSWGIGHAAAIVGAGLALVVLGLTVPPPVALGLDLLVALMLAGIGGRAIWIGRRVASGHAAHTARTPLGAAIVGLVHGASGTAALTLLVLTTIPSRVAAACFIGVFALGATVAMTALSALMAVPLAAATGRWRSIQGTAPVLAGTISIAVAALVAIGALASRG